MLIFRASESALWMGTSTFGLFMSNVFPTSVALAEQYFNVTGTLCFSNNGCCISPDSFRTGALTHFGVNAVKTVEDWQHCTTVRRVGQPPETQKNSVSLSL